MDYEDVLNDDDDGDEMDECSTCGRPCKPFSGECDKCADES